MTKLIQPESDSTIKVKRNHALEDLTINIQDIVRAAAEAAIDMNANELVILDVRGQTSFCDWFILCNGTNQRHIQAIADRCMERLRQDLGVRPLGVEGRQQSKWVLIDLGDVLIHVFDQEMRGYYDLDGLWVDAARVSPESLGIDNVPPEAVGFALP
jgi:ribosome-associated protein